MVGGLLLPMGLDCGVSFKGCEFLYLVVWFGLLFVLGLVCAVATLVVVLIVGCYC